jgi:hypothetical protein
VPWKSEPEPDIAAASALAWQGAATAGAAIAAGPVLIAAAVVKPAALSAAAGHLQSLFMAFPRVSSRLLSSLTRSAAAA